MSFPVFTQIVQEKAHRLPNNRQCPPFQEILILPISVVFQIIRSLPDASRGTGRKGFIPVGCRISPGIGNQFSHPSIITIAIPGG